MAKLGTIKFTGASGTQYEFNVYPWGTDFKKDYGAVYFVTKRTKNIESGYSHTRIYVGGKGDLSTRFDNHHKQKCFGQHGANCICVYGEQGKNTRLKIEEDLTKNYNPPCNEE